MSDHFKEAIEKVYNNLFYMHFIRNRIIYELNSNITYIDTMVLIFQITLFR